MRGILLKICSVVLFIVMAALIKSTSDHIPPGQAVFFRTTLAMPVILVWLMLRKELRTGLRVKSPMGHVWRGLVGTTAMGLGFAGLGYLPLPEVTAISYAAPILVVIFAAMFLGEQVRLFRISAVVLGLIGVLIVLSPRLTVTSGSGQEAEAFGAMLVLGAAVFAALAQVFIRKLVMQESTAAIVFYFFVTASILSLITLPFGWVIPTSTEFGLMILVGVIGGFGQIFLTSSYREADASVIAPFEYVSILFALAIGYWVFDEVPSVTMLAGAGLVVTAGVLIIWRERQLGLERTKQRKAMSQQG
ncbi:MAG: drug/metabolite transporter (DMT)-like permease [Pseudorhodobacter sp.]|jgi:drug/metabolite transporter (DMT)-like permease